MEGSRKRAAGAWRNWAELPEDALLMVFEKLGAFHVLFPAQWVCRAWYRFFRKPGLWRCVDMRGYWDLDRRNEPPIERMTKEAVDRSNGLVEEFYAQGFGNNSLMRYIASRTNGLRCLHLLYCDQISDTGLKNITRRCPLLEELNITYCSFSPAVFRSVGRSCPQLKRFHLNSEWLDWGGDSDTEDDRAAFAIAKTMPELRHLQLVENKLTNVGLSAIIESCPHLESLDIRRCFSVGMDRYTRKELSRIPSLRRPLDSMRDCKFYISSVCGGDQYYDSDWGFDRTDNISEGD